jgi:hypothetical protein
VNSFERKIGLFGKRIGSFSLQVGAEAGDFAAVAREERSKIG